ncbi:MAG: RNA chaperone Hfq [Nitrospirae bacterium]|nr:RNA chaperone Hfq [Nitrospirota bacterium]
MSKSTINLQDQFLNHLRKERTPVTIHILNGTKITGVIKGFDNFSILLKGENQHLIYKHSVALIVPKKAIKDFDLRGEQAEEKKPEEIKMNEKNPDVKSAEEVVNA